MKLINARVMKFKSIDDSGDVAIDPTVTVLVGQNEAGKSAFLQALYKARAADNSGEYDREMDYPRIALNDYEETYGDEPADVVTLTYELKTEEVDAINKELGVEVLNSRTFTITHNYNNGSAIGVKADEAAFTRHLVDTSGLPEHAAAPLRSIASAKELLSTLGEATRAPEVEAFYQSLTAQFGSMPRNWLGADYEIWSKHLKPIIPGFLYFDDYRLLPGRKNLAELQQSVVQCERSPGLLPNQDRAVLGLLRMAKVDLNELLTASTYEAIIAKLEAFSNKVTDRVFKYWKQNDQLEVRIDVRIAPGEPSPFNNGPNLDIRIYNRRHRVTVGFDQRSRGFIWFFSFLVWFDSVRQQIGTNKPLVLLLDEPGLSLHALAQEDFLRYIDDLSRDHQLVYTTHSPFMVHSDRLNQVRLVEDRKELGTKVTATLTGSDPKTIFPLQAALGYTIAQNLFISKRNLLVEGPADLIYLQQASAALDADDRAGLRSDVNNKPHQRIEQLKQDKTIREKYVLNYGMFRRPVGSVPKAKESKNARGAQASGTAPDGALPSTDVEDLFEPAMYLELFNSTFAKSLDGKTPSEADLPPGERIVERLGRFTADNGLVLGGRSKPGFNHYAVANQLAANPPQRWSKETLDRFELLFRHVNGLFQGDGEYE